MTSGVENGRDNVRGVLDGAAGETNGLSSRGKKPHERGIVFRDFDQVKDFEDLVRAVVGHCSIEEQERLREMEDWIVKGDGTWSVLWLVIVASRSRSGCARWRTGLLRVMEPGSSLRASILSWARCSVVLTGRQKV